VLLDENLVVTNDLILAELIPFLRVCGQLRIIALLRHIRKLPLAIDWQQIMEFQYKCLKNGVNGVGIPDFIIVQNALHNDCEIFTLDNHFSLIGKIIPLQLFVCDR
jgi:hypothetical protein